MMMVPMTHYAYSEQGFDDSILRVRQTDIAELMMDKYQIQVEGDQYTLFYRFSSLEGIESGSGDYDAVLTSVKVNQENSSLILNMSNIKQTDLMSVRFSEELLSAEDGNFILLIDGKQRGYETSTLEKTRTLIFVIPQNTSKVELVGNRVIPEFTSSILVLITVSSALLIIPRLGRN